MDLFTLSFFVFALVLFGSVALICCDDSGHPDPARPR